MQVSVRTLTAQDAHRVAEMEAACFSDAWGVDSVSSTIARRDFCGVCVEVDGEMVAYLLGSVLFEDSEVLRVAVPTMHRRKGFGALTLDEFLSRAKAQGATRVFLEVRAGNTAAIGLYHSRGFEKTRVREKYYDGVEDAVEMLKTL